MTKKPIESRGQSNKKSRVHGTNDLKIGEELRSDPE